MPTTELASGLEAYLDVPEIFMEIVQVDSPSKQESAMADYIQDFAAECGFASYRDEFDNVMIQTEGVGEPLFLNAHLDTVQNEGEKVKPVLVDGWIRSDGTTILGADNKVSVASILSLLRRISREGTAHYRPLDVVFSTSEETGNDGAIGFDKSLIRAKTGFIADAEMPLGSIISASPYYARFDIEIQGKASHAAYREEAIPAIPPLIDLLSQIEAMRSAELLVNIGRIEGGTKRNTVMGDILLNGELRSFDSQIFSQAIETLQGILGQVFAAQIIWEIVVENPGYQHTERDLEEIKNQIEGVLGTEVEIKPTFGVSDGNLFNSDQLKVFTIGDGALAAHTKEERVEVTVLLQLAQLLHLLSLAST